MSYVTNTILAKNISYGGVRSPTAIKYIVFHYTGNSTDTARANANFFRSENTRAAGAHYFVDETMVVQSITDNRIAYAVGGAKYGNCGSTGGGKLYGKCTNSNSISIEMCSQHGKIPEKTIANAVELARKLMKKYNIPAERCIRHFDVTGKSCPGWTGWLGNNAPKWNALKRQLIVKDDVPAIMTMETDEAVNIRLSSGKSNPVVGEFYKDTVVSATILENTANWNKISVWVAKKQCSDYITGSSANIRMKAGKTNTVVGEFNEGINIKDAIRSQTDNWYEIDVWVPKKLFK